MLSEQRLHPATLFFELAKHIKNFAVPALFVIFGASQSSGGPFGMFGRFSSGWEAWLLVFFVPATIASVFRYMTFRLRYDDNELVVRSGWIFRTERHVPFSRIHNVDAIQNVFHRLFDVVEVRVETGGGKEEEARLSVLPRAAFDEMRERVFGSTGHLQTDHLEPGNEAPGTEAPGTEHSTHPTHRTHSTHPVLVHLSLRELLLCGFLENKGMVLVGAAYGVFWEIGFGSVWERLFTSTGMVDRSLFRALTSAVFDDGPWPIGRLVFLVAGIPVLLIIVRIISMIWALVRLFDFRLTRIGEDLRSEYGLLTKVAATVPIRRVQSITIAAGPLHRWLKRATVRVATSGGAGNQQQTSNAREWLAPLIRQKALPHLLQQVLPGFDLTAVTWQPVHPRAFRRAVTPALIVTALITVGAAFVIGKGAIGVLVLLVPWFVISTQKHVQHLGWAEDDEVVVMRSGWISRQITIARVNKIQAVAMHQTPFDRRAGMARVRVDTAGAGQSHRVDIPYLDHMVASALAQRLSGAAANTAFRW